MPKERKQRTFSRTLSEWCRTPRASVVVFVRPGCPHCSRATAMLKKKGIDHVIVDLSDLSAKRDAAMVSATGGHATVPRVFVNASFVGGADDLEEHLLSKRARSAK